MKSSLRPKARPKKGMKSSLRPKARPSGKLPSTSEGTPIEIGPMPERGDIELMLKEQKEKSLLRPTRDGEALTTKPYLQPRADGTGLTTDPENMKSGGKVRGYGLARGGKVCKMR